MTFFDFYADLENPFLESAVVLPAPSAVLQNTSGDTEDSDDVERLVKQLHAAKDSRLDAEFDLDSDFEFEDPASDDEAPSASKRPRVCSKSDGCMEISEAFAAAPAKSQSKEYWYNPVTSRWETRDPVKEAEAAKQVHLAQSQSQGKARGVSHRQLFNYKTDLCWQFKRGACKKGSRCYWAHGSAELRSGGDAELLKKRVVAECVAEARADSNGGACEYPQALVVRIAIRFEEKLDEILPVMAQAGLPASDDKRTTVKALMRLCHPDKCRHPEAKKAMQILGPLLGKR